MQNDTNDVFINYESYTYFMFTLIVVECLDLQKYNQVWKLGCHKHLNNYGVLLYKSPT